MIFEQFGSAPISQEFENPAFFSDVFLTEKSAVFFTASYDQRRKSGYHKSINSLILVLYCIIKAIFKV